MNYGPGTYKVLLCLLASLETSHRVNKFGLDQLLNDERPPGKRLCGGEPRLPNWQAALQTRTTILLTVPAPADSQAGAPPGPDELMSGEAELPG